MIWDRGFDSRWGHGCSSLVFFVCCVSSGLCGDLITRSEESYRVRVCLIVCDLETSTTRRIGPDLDCSATEKTATEFDSSGSGYGIFCEHGNDSSDSIQSGRIFIKLISVILQTSPCHVKLRISDSLLPVSGKAVRCTSHRCSLEVKTSGIHSHNSSYSKKHIKTAARNSAFYNTLILGRFPRVPHKWPVSLREKSLGEYWDQCRIMAPEEM